jgi:hypothetical protein
VVFVEIRLADILAGSRYKWRSKVAEVALGSERSVFFGEAARHVSAQGHRPFFIARSTMLVKDALLVYVPGRGMPTRLHPTIESARAAVQALRDQGNRREIVILGCVEYHPGRRVIGLREGQSAGARKPAEPSASEAPS